MTQPESYTHVGIQYTHSTGNAEVFNKKAITPTLFTT